jgi:hypothetical protein
MSIPEYDNAAKWATFFRRLPFWLKALLGMAVIVAVAIFLYARFGPIRELQRENLSLKNGLSQAQSEISSLRDKKDELHRENLHLKELIDPIKKKAELIYPEMEAAAAIAKLAENLQNVRSLATRDVYKPLAQDNKDMMIAALKELQTLHSALPVSVSILVDQGSVPRSRVANDLKQYLQEAGWDVKLSTVMTFYSGTPLDISIKNHPDDMKLAQEFTGIVGRLFINKQFAGIKRDKFSRGHLEIKINGDPLFAESGIVTFR